MALSPTRNYSNCTFPRLTLHACALTRTISLSYRGISLSFHLVTEVFQLVTQYFTFPVRFQLNSDFSHTFLNGQLTRHTIIIIVCVCVCVLYFFVFPPSNDTNWIIIFINVDMGSLLRTPICEEIGTYKITSDSPFLSFHSV